MQTLVSDLKFLNSFMLKLAENEQQRAGHTALGIRKVGKAKCVRVYLRCKVEKGNLFDYKKRKNTI